MAGVDIKAGPPVGVLGTGGYTVDILKKLASASTLTTSSLDRSVGDILLYLHITLSHYLHITLSLNTLISHIFSPYPHTTLSRYPHITHSLFYPHTALSRYPHITLSLNTLISHTLSSTLISHTLS